MLSCHSTEQLLKPRVKHEPFPPKSFKTHKSWCCSNLSFGRHRPGTREYFGTLSGGVVARENQRRRGLQAISQGPVGRRVIAGSDCSQDLRSSASVFAIVVGYISPHVKHASIPMRRFQQSCVPVWAVIPTARGPACDATHHGHSAKLRLWRPVFAVRRCDFRTRQQTEYDDHLSFGQRRFISNAENNPKNVVLIESRRASLCRSSSKVSHCACVNFNIWSRTSLMAGLYNEQWEGVVRSVANTASHGDLRVFMFFGRVDAIASVA